MKILGLIAVSLALAFASCQKPEVVVAPPPTPPPAPPPVAATTPLPETPPPATPARHLAAEGVFYLTTWVRVENSDGVTGLPPGTGVKLVKPGVYLTPAGEWPLADNVITNDLDIARRARDAGLAGRALAAQRQATEEARAAALQAAADGAATDTRDGQLKDINRERLTKRLAELKQQKADLETRRSQLASAQGKEAVGRAKGRIELATTDQEMDGTQATLRSLREQIADIEKTLREIK